MHTPSVIVGTWEVLNRWQSYYGALNLVTENCLAYIR